MSELARCDRLGSWVDRDFEHPSGGFQAIRKEDSSTSTLLPMRSRSDIPHSLLTGRQPLSLSDGRLAAGTAFMRRRSGLTATLGLAMVDILIQGLDVNTNLPYRKPILPPLAPLPRQRVRSIPTESEIWAVGIRRLQFRVCCEDFRFP